MSDFRIVTVETPWVKFATAGVTAAGGPIATSIVELKSRGGIAAESARGQGRRERRGRDRDAAARPRASALAAHQARAERLRGTADFVGRLLNRQPEDIAQHNRGAILLGEGVQLGVENLAEVVEHLR